MIRLQDKEGAVHIDPNAIYAVARPTAKQKIDSPWAGSVIYFRCSDIGWFAKESPDEVAAAIDEASM
tara:strand:+ start:79 stop:279 length:201 start_codon:yes stop_codon:yes gene_type:complete